MLPDFKKTILVLASTSRAKNVWVKYFWLLELAVVIWQQAFLWSDNRWLAQFFKYFTRIRDDGNNVNQIITPTRYLYCDETEDTMLYEWSFE